MLAAIRAYVPGRFLVMHLELAMRFAILGISERDCSGTDWEAACCVRRSHIGSSDPTLGSSDPTLGSSDPTLLKERN